MKKFRLILFLLLAVAWGVEAATITVSKDADNPGQYDDLQAAVDAASAGDTILIAASTINYGSITIEKKIILIGPGLNQEVDGEYVDIGDIILGEQGPTLPDASDSEIYGIKFDALEVKADVNNISISKCDIGRLYILSAISNFRVINCIINNASNYGLWFRNFYSTEMDISGNILFSNNIIQTMVLHSQSGTVKPSFDGKIVFRNNVFLARNSQSLPAFDITGAVLENNIFWASEPIGCEECSFNSNITYANFIENQEDFQQGNPNSTFTNNIVEQDPLFENYDGGFFEWSDNLNLKSNSPAIGAGIDGVNLGIYDGSYPWNISVDTIMPEVTSLAITESNVPEDGQLEFTFSAEKQ